MRWPMIFLAVVGLALVGLLWSAACDREPEPTPTEEPVRVPQRLIRLMTDGYMRLAIEYGVELNRDHLYAMLDDNAQRAQESGKLGMDHGDVILIGVLDVFTDAEDMADRFREDAIDDGQSPYEAIQDLAELVKSYAAAKGWGQ